VSEVLGGESPEELVEELTGDHPQEKKKNEIAERGGTSKKESTSQKDARLPQQKKEKHFSCEKRIRRMGLLPGITWDGGKDVEKKGPTETVGTYTLWGVERSCRKRGSSRSEKKKRGPRCGKTTALVPEERRTKRQRREAAGGKKRYRPPERGEEVCTRVEVAGKTRPCFRCTERREGRWKKERTGGSPSSP